MRSICLFLVILSAVPRFATGEQNDSLKSADSAVAGPNRVVAANEGLNPILNIIDLKSTEDFKLNLAVTLFISEFVVDQRFNSHTLMLALVPMGISSGTPHGYKLGINCHNVVDFYVDNGVATIKVEEFTGFENNEPAYKISTYKVEYRLKEDNESPEPKITIYRQE